MLNGDIREDANKLTFPSEKVEKRNTGQILRKINKKKKSDSVCPVSLQFKVGVVCSLLCGKI